MNAELLNHLEYWERRRGIQPARLLAAVEEALVRRPKRVGPARDLRVSVDSKSGDIKLMRS